MLFYKWIIIIISVGYVSSLYSDTHKPLGEDFLRGDAWFDYGAYTVLPDYLNNSSFQFVLQCTMLLIKKSPPSSEYKSLEELSKETDYTSKIFEKTVLKGIKELEKTNLIDSESKRELIEYVYNSLMINGAKLDGMVSMIKLFSSKYENASFQKIYEDIYENTKCDSVLENNN